ncbi:MAG TPA: endonuclease V [Methanoregula sp.]|nr:endonuclease V [Methanoregula sp.]
MVIQTETKYPKRAPSEFIRAPDPAEALKLQERLRYHCILERTIDICEIRHLAGADAAYDQDTIYAAVVVMTFPGLEVVEKTCSVQKVTFPYIPGLLSFREGPAILDAFSNITTVPDLIVMHGHGYAHPKRFGLASHIGLHLDIPSIGVAKRLLIGDCALPGAACGSTEPVRDNSEIIGRAVRTVQDAKPVFVSAGHKVDLAQAVDMALKTTTIHRITEPVWHADRVSRQCRDSQSGTELPSVSD